MPYSAEHKQQTRERIVESARQLFNRYGFSDVSIDQVMTKAGLTRGGFYNHFASKDELYIEAVDAFRRKKMSGGMGQGKSGNSKLAQQVIKGYLSKQHLENVDGHCPMIALPSDIARAGPQVRAAYAAVLEGLASMLTCDSENESQVNSRDRSLGLAALCVGGMVLARTVDDVGLADEIRQAAQSLALEITA